MLILNSVMAFVVLWCSFAAIDSMSWGTMHCIRVVYCLICVVAFAQLVLPLFGYWNPSGLEPLLNFVLALFLAIDRRRPDRVAGAL